VKESVACGRPVVSRRVGDVDFLESCPACVAVGDTSDEIAQGILRARDIVAVDGDAVKPYELPTVTAQLIELYREVARRRDG